MSDMQSEISILSAWVLVAIAAERITEIIVEGSIFTELRSLIAKWSFTDGPYALIRNKIGTLITCGWCCNAWICFICSFALPGEKLKLIAYDNFIIKWFAVYYLSNLFHAIIRLVHLGRVKTFDVELKVQEVQAKAVDDE